MFATRLFNGSNDHLDNLVATIVIRRSDSQTLPYSSDLNAARLVEDAISDRGLHMEYEDALWEVTKTEGSRGFPDGAAIAVSHWNLIHADAAQRCIAALAACGVSYPVCP